MRQLNTIIALICSTALCVEAQPGSRQPNIIIILADDLAYADIEGYGANYATPNLLKLQQEGIRFTNFYSQPQCSPSRAALLTGCYPQRVGIPWVVGPEGPAWTKDKSYIGLNPDEETLPELLKQKNYTTACIGKWHLGHHKQHLPTNHGFDEYFGLPYSNDMWPPNMDEWPDLPLIEGETSIQKNPDQTTLTSQYISKAVDFIKRNKSKPFFLYLAHSMPHVPIYASKNFRGKSGKGLYIDVIQELDWSVGEVMKALHKHGIDDNTLVIFTSDNGPWLTYGNHAGSAGNLREGKATTFEGGVRVPFIARWRGRITPGSTSNEVAALIDVLPTVLSVADSKSPEKVIDGKSILPVLLGQKKTSERNVQYYFHVDELQAIRKGKWKLHLPHRYEHVNLAGKDGARGQSVQLQIEISLFDLENDPGETKNIAAENPEKVRELKELAETFSAEIDQERRAPGKSN